MKLPSCKHLEVWRDDALIYSRPSLPVRAMMQDALLRTA
jgi:hypothetical protein